MPGEPLAILNKKRVPKKPHWRYIYLKGKDHPEWDAAFDAFKEYAESEKVPFRYTEAQLGHLGNALTLFEKKPVAKMIQDLLLEQVAVRSICDIIKKKFNIDIVKEDIFSYRKFFFDMDTFDHYEMYEMIGAEMPPAPPVPNSMREAYTEFRYGGDAKIDADKALEHLFQRAFFRTGELAKLGVHGDKHITSYMKEAVNIYKTMKDYSVTKDLPEGFDILVEYPEDTAISIEDLEDDSVD